MQELPWAVFGIVRRMYRNGQYTGACNFAPFLVSISSCQIHEGAYLQTVGNLASTSSLPSSSSSSFSTSSFLAIFLFPRCCTSVQAAVNWPFFAFLLFSLSLPCRLPLLDAVSSFFLGLFVFRIVSCCPEPIKSLHEFHFHSPHFIPG